MVTYVLVGRASKSISDGLVKLFQNEDLPSFKLVQSVLVEKLWCAAVVNGLPYEAIRLFV